MEHLKEVASVLRKQLADIEAQIAKYEVTSDIMTHDEMCEKVEMMGTSPMWKKFVQRNKPYGVVYNITSLLDECYDHFASKITDLNKDIKYTDIIGEKNSREWQLFILNVIKELIDPEDFEDDYDYEDTANGYDELVWEEGCRLINKLVKEKK